MPKQDFLKELDAIWANNQRILGARIPPAMREHLESLHRVDPQDPESIEELNISFKEQVPAYKMMLEEGRAQSGEEKPTKRKAKKTRETIRMQSLEPRLRLVNFVVSKNTLSKGRLKLQFDWKRTLKEWKEAQPLRCYTSEAVLKEAYYRAVREWPSAQMQRWVAWHTNAIRALMNLRFDDFHAAELRKVIEHTLELSDDCDVMIQHYKEAALPGRFLHDSLAHLVEMWNQYLGTLDRYAKEEVLNERQHTAEKQE